ncbi:MAG: hypothetical protein JXX29_13325 [Deltaproteobacteria bacterium]|nr:hypothetical protein [Deltaproteobacteria bacterium]MBN2672660.1 hypothetical protein [Deltaproteobacteria bacterium]
MDIKIQPGKSLPKIDTSADASVQVASEKIDAGKAEENDPITAIAVELVEGRIDSAQAVNRLIAETMSMDMVAAAPESLRVEVEEVLRAAIETDPYLVSLTQKLD